LPRLRTCPAGTGYALVLGTVNASWDPSATVTLRFSVCSRFVPDGLHIRLSDVADLDARCRRLAYQGVVDQPGIPASTQDVAEELDHPACRTSRWSGAFCAALVSNFAAG
jgi:hypothetical protein